MLTWSIKMYTYRMLDKGEFIFHDASGCSLPYHSKVNRYVDIPKYKQEFFQPWLGYSNNKRKNIKKKAFEMNDCNCNLCIPLAPLPKAVPVETIKWSVSNDDWFNDCSKQEGKTPMRYNDNYASASVTSPKSDTANQRDYLLDRLSSTHYPKSQELTKLFNLYVNNTPKTYKDLIDAIKNDKFKLDDKRVKLIEAFDPEDYPEDYFPYAVFDGIIWDGPQPDRKGYSAATSEMGKQFLAAKDTIMTTDGTEGRKALQAFEAWLPTPATTTAH